MMLHITKCNLKLKEIMTYELREHTNTNFILHMKSHPPHCGPIRSIGLRAAKKLLDCIKLMQITGYKYPKTSSCNILKPKQKNREKQPNKYKVLLFSALLTNKKENSICQTWTISA